MAHLFAEEGNRHHRKFNGSGDRASCPSKCTCEMVPSKSERCGPVYGGDSLMSRDDGALQRARSSSPAVDVRMAPEDSN